MSDLRESLESAFDDNHEAAKTEVQAESPAEPPAESGPAATETPKEGPNSESKASSRDEKGRFTGNNKPQTEAESVPAAQPSERPHNPFSSWKPAAREALMKADRGEVLTVDELKLIKSEAERRESDFHKGVNEFKSHGERAKAYDAAVAPFQQHIQKLGVDAPTAIKVLLNADVILRTSDPTTKARYFHQLAREYGIDVNAAVAAGPAPQVDPQTQYMMQQLNELRQSQQMWQSKIEQQEQQQTLQQLQEFAKADKPHFEAVRNDMADLLEAGKASTLQEAYDMAVWLVPEVRSTLLSEQIAEAQRKLSNQNVTQKAKTATVSVKGSVPNGASSNSGGSLRDVLEASYSELN